MKKIVYVALILITMPINVNSTPNRTNIAGLRFHNHDIQLPTNGSGVMSPGDFVPYQSFFYNQQNYFSSTELQMLINFTLYLNNGTYYVAPNIPPM